MLVAKVALLMEVSAAGVDWRGVERSGVECSGVEWGGMWDIWQMCMAAISGS